MMHRNGNWSSCLRRCRNKRFITKSFERLARKHSKKTKNIYDGTKQEIKNTKADNTVRAGSHCEARAVRTSEP